MKVVEVETDDIGTFKSIIEILNGTVPEANADFIKDAKAFNASLDKQKKADASKSQKSYDDDYDEDDDDEDSSSGHHNSKETKGVLPKAKQVAGKKPVKKDEDDKKKVVKTTNKKKVESEDEEEDAEPEEDEAPVRGKGTKGKAPAKPVKPVAKATATKGKVPAKTSKKDIVEEDEEDDTESRSSKASKASVKQKASKAVVPAKKGKADTKKKSVADDDEDDDDEGAVNPGQIKILTADQNQVMIIYIVLNGSAFNKFVVHPDKYSVGLNLDELSKYIKNVEKEGTMSIHIDSDDTQHIIFDVKGDNSATRESICELRVVNLPSRNDRKIEINVTMVVRINCHAFHKACKDLMQFSQFVEITCDPSQLAITCKGDMSNHKRIFKADGTQDGIVIKTVKKDDDEDDDVPDIIRLVFDLKYINSMYKCSNLCDDMEIYLNSESIMFLKYGIKLMGEMLVGISPSRKKKEQADNYDENMDNFYKDDDEIQLI
ncbi:putative proliferating cell nuclear antigen [Yasminevirus sp. GU-2018]|uniref:Putative proliferating cell nuclear antigen n=1 Tax=Yasminevirus sp. GU-2018 TaxID=2420051 RepID=A0A5K0UA14_9VIRU|nr:putative proliferating cell nuclear antigen [Yasminevirus sp. GU-2018]